VASVQQLLQEGSYLGIACCSWLHCMEDQVLGQESVTHILDHGDGANARDPDTMDANSSKSTAR
jgi:hypothetical protein